MKKIILAFVAFTSLVFTSCSDEDNTPTLEPIKVKTIKNLHAPQTTDYTVNPPATTGNFVKFSFKEGSEVTGNNWDIAFRGTTILVNGGTKIDGLINEPSRTGKASLAIVSNTFSEVKTVPKDIDFKQDASGSYALPKGSGNGWYTYTGAPKHLIIPIAGKVIVVKTIDGNYVKMEILSYYKNSTPEKDTSRYFTFNYVYNPNKGEKSFK